MHAAVWRCCRQHDQVNLSRSQLKTPRAAALAGILFSILLLTSFSLLRISAPDEHLPPGAWLSTHGSTIALALHLIPFAGIAFLWFIGVLRGRLGDQEDRLLATVFLGSGLLFLAALFAAAAVAGAMVIVFGTKSNQTIDLDAFAIQHRLAFNLMNIYAVKMAAVFMISTSTVALYTMFVPRYIAYLGYVSALILLFGSYHLSWSFFVFPLWVLVLSVHILIDDLWLRSPAFEKPRPSFESESR
jgi:hypothetical protein